MLNIQGKIVEVNNSNEEVYKFLSDFNNFEKLLPSDRVSNFKSDSDSCAFEIKGLASIGMRISEKEAPSKIHVKSDGKNPFPFTLDLLVNPLTESSCTAQLVFNGDMNAFLKMMAEKPLTNFFNMLADNLQENYA